MKTLLTTLNFTKALTSHKALKPQSTHPDHIKVMKDQFKTYEPTPHIDQTTWDDLNMDDVYAKIDHTFTSPGMYALYSRLKQSPTDLGLLEELKTQVKSFKNHSEIIRKVLHACSKTKLDVLSVFNQEVKHSTLYLMVLYAMRLAFFGMFYLMFLTFSKATLYTAILIFGANYALHLYLSSKHGSSIDSLVYVAKLLYTAEKLIKPLSGDLPHLSLQLENQVGALKKLKKSTSLLMKIEGLDILSDYMNISLLAKEVAFFKSILFIQKNKATVTDLYHTLGQVDLIQSLAYLKNSHTHISFACVSTDYQGIQMQEGVHPLLENPVANSCHHTSPVLIMGSNMSGKSTYLRTLAVNTLLGQSIGLTYAKVFRAQPLNIMTSISLNDDIKYGKSYFLVEAEAIKRMVVAPESPYRNLYLIDEIFKGTNPQERLSAAQHVLSELEVQGHLVIVTTHDAALLAKVKHYEHYSFVEHVTKESLNFPYLIHQGMVSSQNAIKILDYLGYPPKLIQAMQTTCKDQVS